MEKAAELYIKPDSGILEVNSMENKKCCSLKTIFMIIGAIVSIAAVIVVAYTIFKKYFKITFDCDGNCADCDGCDEEYFEDECEAYEPICCCQDDEDGEDEEAVESI